MYIGNTNLETFPANGKTVYPYVYREHAKSYQSSSDNPRFIPMYIGNTKLVRPDLVVPAVYPYVYREHTFAISFGFVVPGLSLCI